MALLQTSWRSILTAAVPLTESPFCVTGSPVIPRGGFNHIQNRLWSTTVFIAIYLLFFFSLPFFFVFSFAYIEFSDRDSVTSAIGLHETLFRGRVLKVR